jgi:hypothetical protein
LSSGGGSKVMDLREVADMMEAFVRVGKNAFVDGNAERSSNLEENMVVVCFFRMIDRRKDSRVMSR